MENVLTPPDTPDRSATEEIRKYSVSDGSKKSNSPSPTGEIYRKFSDEEVYSRTPSPNEATRKASNTVKYSTLPGATSFTVFSTDKTNLKFGSVFSLSSLSDSSEKRSRKLSVTSVSSEKPKRRFSLLSIKKKKLSTEQNSPTTATASEDTGASDSAATVSDYSPLSDSAAVSSGKKPGKVNKFLKKLSFSKKPKKLEDESEDTMDGKNGRGGKKKGGKNKFKKINPDEDNAFTQGSKPDTAALSSNAFVYNEREVKERENRDQSNPVEGLSNKSTPLSIPISSQTSPSSVGGLLAPAQSQDLDSTTDNDDYDTPMGTSPTSSQVMPHVSGSYNKVDNLESLDATLKNSSALNVKTPVSSVVSTPTPTPTPTPAPAPTPEPVLEPAPIPDNLPSDVKSPSDLKKEILSITTPIVTEAGRKKHEPKSSVSSSSSSVEKDSLPAVNGSNTSAVAGKTSNGKEVSPYAKMPEKREYLYKILVIGELGAGKTSIIKRYVHQFFSPHYRATIGVDFALKVLSWDQETIIRLQLWDIAGQERFGNMTRVYYKEAVGAFIVFDVTRAATFDAVLKWKQDLDAKVTLPDGNSIPCVLLANKSDQPKEAIANNAAKIDDFVKENNFSAWFETSAKDNLNIDEAAKTLVQKILENDKVQANGESAGAGETVFSLNKSSKETSNRKNCAC